MLQALKERILKINHGKTALERGQEIRKHFPELAENTIALADQAMQDMLVLPGTGPELYFVGNPPKWEYNPIQDNEYTFHLNRLHHLKTLAEAYSLTGNPAYAKKAVDELENWITTVACPSLYDEHRNYAPLHFDGLSPWRALEVGIRGYRTWPIIIELLADTPYFTEEFLEKLFASVKLHCQILYHISPLLWPKADHNHYLMENLGLMSLCLLFPEMENSTLYLEHAQRELDRCMEAQCTPCGAQIEGCASYHNGCIFWFAMRIVFARKFGLSVPESYSSRLALMFQHSVQATRPCGGNFPWGDSHTWKETMSLAAVSCYMAYGETAYLKTALHFYDKTIILEDIRDNLWRIPDAAACANACSALKDSEIISYPLTAWKKDTNQVFVRTGWNKNAIAFMTACRTPVQNMHAHIDAGGFDFVAFGKPLISDPGIYTYKNDENRKHFKSAFWHNCLTINHQNMWEYRASWSYGPQKKGSIESVSETEHAVSVVSSHCNYEPVTAVRCLSLIDQRFLLLIDQAIGLKQEDSVQIHLHLNMTHLKKTALGIISTEISQPNVELIWEPQMNLNLECGKISTSNDVWHDSLLIHLEQDAEKNQTFYHACMIIPHNADDHQETCRSFHTEQTPDGFSVFAVLDAISYHFLWDGKHLTIKERNLC